MGVKYRFLLVRTFAEPGMSAEQGFRGGQDLMRRFLKRVNGVCATKKDGRRVMLIMDRSMVWY